MDRRFEWRKEYNIGVDVIDQEHQQLFRVITRLFSFQEEQKDSQWTCREGIKYFKGHAIKHFGDEEAYMASIQYEGLKQHQQIHRDFRENILPTLEQELERTNYSQEAMDHFLGVCAGWLVGHTLTEDQAITKGTHMSKWENLLPGEGLEAMKELVVQSMFDVFQLESQVVSETYGGEKFGDGVYYRLIYGVPNSEEKFEVILVFEEKLLINTIGKILGIRTNKLDSLLVNGIRYTARQLVQRMLEHFTTTPPKLEGETLLSYEQFRRVFDQEKPQVSLLFDTGGAGYFSYCIIAPHLLEMDVGIQIVPTNALAEVERYLTSRETQEKQAQAKPKKKILVVDDSITVREKIRQLLEEDYEVAVAESGVAAIRTITLNRPDLVLLDYEMPICDGKQTLEMLRSEKDFADIPVIFLTGRKDTQTMIDVMHLKPADYLTKDSKPADIKSGIDAFFK